MEKKIFISGKKLFQHRKAAKLSQEDIADKIGTSRQTINIWEKREEIELNPDQAGKLAKILKVNIDDLTNEQTHPEVKNHDKSIMEDAGNVYRKFFEEQTDYLVIPKVMFDDYEMVPKSEQAAKRSAQEVTNKMISDAMEQQRDFIKMLKEDLKKAEESGRSLKTKNM
jgi:DNA-binding XRE family transcriptional regulator